MRPSEPSKQKILTRDSRREKTEKEVKKLKVTGREKAKENNKNE